MICMFLFSTLFIISCVLNKSLSLSQNITDIPLLIENKPYSTSLNQNQSKPFHINIEHYPSLSYIFITLHCYSGKAALSLTDSDEFARSYSKYYHSAGNTQYYQIATIDSNKSFNFIATITAYSNIYYSISYTTSINIAYHHFYINSNILQLNALSSIDELAHYHLNNPLYNNDITIDSFVFIDVTAINCEIKTKFNNNTSYSKHNQYMITRNDSEIKKKEFDITIEVISFDSKSTNIPHEMCMFYIGNSILNQNTALLIDEGVIHLFTLNNEITSLSFKHPFFITRANEEFFISITKLNEGKLNIKYYTYEIDRCSTTNEVILIHKHNKKIMLKAFDMQHICEVNTICWVHLEVSYNSADNENKYLKELLFQIEIVANAYQVPTYLPYGIIRHDAVYAFQYRYYYTTITNYNEGEIVLNFIHGSGTAIAKVVPYNHTDKDGNWNGRIRLPVKEDIMNDNESSTNHLLEFDYFNSKFVFNETILQKQNITCEHGCEIYIGVFAEDITMMIGTPIYEFTIYIRNDDTIVNLPLNENVFGSLKRTEKYNEYDYYTFKVFSHSSKLLFDFSSSLCSLYINYGTSPPSYTNYNWYIDNTKRFFELNISDTILSTNMNNTSFYGNDFTIAISAKNLAGSYNAFYSFKTMDIINETDIPIIEIPSSKGEMCFISDNYDRCYFIISKREYDYVYKMYIYAKSEDHPDNANVELYANIVNMDYYDGIKGANANPIYEHSNTFPNESRYMFSSKGNAIGNGVNGKYLCVDFYGFTSDAYVLITLISDVKGRFMVMSTFHAPPMLGMLKPNADELVYLNTGFRTQYVIQGNDVYMVEIVHVLGEGDIKIIHNETNDSENDINNDNGFYHLGETSKYKSIAFVLQSSYKKYLYIKALSYNTHHSTVDVDAHSHFLFYIRFYSHNPNENLNEVSYGRSMLIVYDNTHQLSQISNMFPISLSIPIDNTISSNDNDGYLEINVELRYNNTFIIPSFFELTGVITNENFILNRKANIEALPEVGATTYKLFYDESLGIATFLFNKQDINNYFTISSTKIAYISLQPRIKATYTSISVNTLALFSNEILTIPNDKYYYSLNTIKQGVQLKFKLNKLAYAHKVMSIEIAKVGDVEINFFLLKEHVTNEHNSVIHLNNTNIRIIKDEFKYGKYYIDIDIEYFIKEGNDIKELVLGLTSVKHNLQNYLIKYTTTENVNDNENVIELKEGKFQLENKGNKTTTITFNSVYVSGNHIRNVVVIYTLKTYPIYSYANINEVYSIYLTQPPLKVYHYYNNTSLLNEMLSFEITDLPKGQIYLSLIAYIQYKDNNGNFKEELLSYEPMQHYKGSFLPFNTTIPLHNTVIFLITISMILFCIFLYCYRMIRRMHLQHVSETNEYSFLINHK